MTVITVLHSTIPHPDVSSPQTVTSPSRMCCFCPDRARPGSLMCDRCASAWWEVLRSSHPDEYARLGSLDEARRRIYAIRENHRQHELRRMRQEVAARQQLAPVAVVPMRLMLDKRLRGSVVAPRVYAAYAAQGADARWVSLNNRLVAKALGYNLQTVRRGVEKLLTCGYLEKQRGYVGMLIRCRTEA